MHTAPVGAGVAAPLALPGVPTEPVPSEPPVPPEPPPPDVEDPPPPEPPAPVREPQPTPPPMSAASSGEQGGSQQGEPYESASGK